MTRDDLPDPPVDVRLVLLDGTRIPVECAYEGRSADGVDQWSVITSVAADRCRGITVQTWPPRTSIEFPGIAWPGSGP
jgi:hypothetical protein